MTVLVDTRNLNNSGLGNMARRVDKSTYAPVGITWTHKSVHDGVHWYCNEGYGPWDPGEFEAVNFPLLLTPAAPQVVHFSMGVYATSAVRVRFYENVTPVAPEADGVPFYNNRRTSNNTIQTTRWTTLNPNVAAATILATATIGTATAPGSLEWWQGDLRLLLKPEIYYMVTFDNFDDGIYVSFEMDLIETAEIL